MAYFRIIGSFDPKPLLDQIAAHPELWDQNRIRTFVPTSPHHQASDILLRFYDLGERILWPDDAFKLDRADYPARATLPAVEPFLNLLMAEVECLPGDLHGLGSVLIAKLAPGKVIQPHTDLVFTDGAPHLSKLEQPAVFYDRYQIVLQGAATFTAADEVVEMQAGEIWWFDNSVRHGVEAVGEADRIVLIVDVHGRRMMQRRLHEGMLA